MLISEQLCRFSHSIFERTSHFCGTVLRIWAEFCGYQHHAVELNFAVSIEVLLECSLSVNYLSFEPKRSELSVF